MRTNFKLQLRDSVGELHLKINLTTIANANSALQNVTTNAYDEFGTRATNSV